MVTSPVEFWNLENGLVWYFTTKTVYNDKTVYLHASSFFAFQTQEDSYNFQENLVLNRHTHIHPASILSDDYNCNICHPSNFGKIFK